MASIAPQPSDTLFIVPTMGDRLDYLRSCLESVRAQGVNCHLRLVAPDTQRESLLGQVGDLVDDFVPDGGTGLSEALNRGFHDAERFEFLAWLGDDDMLESGSLGATRRALLDHPRSPFAYGGLRWIDASGEEFRTTTPLGFEHWIFLKRAPNLIWQPGSLMRSCAFISCGRLDPNYRYAMDLDLFIRLDRIGRPRVVRRLLASYRVHDSSLSVSGADLQRTEADQARNRPTRTRLSSRMDDFVFFLGRVVFRLSSRKKRGAWA